VTCRKTSMAFVLVADYAQIDKDHAVRSVLRSVRLLTPALSSIEEERETKACDACD